MKANLAAFALILSFSSLSWAGPIEEVNEISAPRAKALAEGNVDAWTAAFASDAVLHSYSTPFRIEGRDAIRVFFASWFQVVPKRKLVARPPLSRAYGDNLVVQDGHGDYYVTDQQGKASYVALRWTVVWSKASGQWQIISQHASVLPGTN